MTKSIVEIETRVLDFIEKSSYSKVLNILTEKSDNLLRILLTDEFYLSDKLNLCVWLLSKCESQLAFDLMDCDFLSDVLKLTKIYDAFHSIGLVDSNQTNFQKLILQTNAKNYKDLLLLINELIELILMATKIDAYEECAYDSDARAYAKLEILHDNDYIREYCTVVDSNSSLIPSDLASHMRKVLVNKTNPHASAQEKNDKLKSDLEAIGNQIGKYEIVTNNEKFDSDKTLDEIKKKIFHTNQLLNEFKDFSLSIGEPCFNVCEEDFDCVGAKFEEIINLSKKLQTNDEFYRFMSQFLSEQDAYLKTISKFLSSKSELRELLQVTDETHENEEASSIISKLKNSISILKS